MRNKFFIIFFFLSLLLVAQEEQDSPLIEIFALLEDSSKLPNTPNNNFSFTLSTIGTAWYVSYSGTQIIHTISNAVSGGTVYPLVNADYWKYTGFNYSLHDNHSYPEFGFGFYKLQSSSGNFIYLDYRDTRYSSYTYCIGHCADIWIKYDVNSKGLFIKSSGGYPWSGPVQNGEIFPIWEYKGQGVPATSNVPYYWQNCLVIIPDESETHPRLVWGPHPTMQNIIYYGVFRGVSPDGSIPPSLNEFS